MKIEIWSDFTCPNCYIGKRRLEKALEQFEASEYIDIEYKSYELDPNALIHNEDSQHTILMRKYGVSLDVAKEMAKQITIDATDVDLYFTFDNMMHTNTFHAHRLVKYAAQYDKHLEMVERLFNRYFIQKQNIGEREVLLAVAAEIGLDMSEIEELLCLNKFGKKVRLDEEVAEELGITSVPFFVFDETYAISGVQSSELFLNILSQIWQESDMMAKSRTPKSEKASYCTGNECKSE